MLEVVAERQEETSEHPADATRRTESAPNPESGGSQESASDPQAVAEQSTPISSALPSTRPPPREVLVRVLSRVSESPIEIDAAIEEMKGLAGQQLHGYIETLELVLSARLDAQGDRLDTHNGEIRVLGQKIDTQGAATQTQFKAQGEKIDTQGAAAQTQFKAQGERIDANTSEIRALSAKVDAQDAANQAQFKAQGEKIDANTSEIRALRAETKAQGTETRAQFGALDVKIESLRREHRLTKFLFASLIALGVFGWLGDGCSRRVESNGGAEASQTAAESSGDARSSAAATREPSEESLETDETAEADSEESGVDPEARRSTSADPVAGISPQGDHPPDNLAE